MDNDNSKSIDVNELLRFCGHKKRSRASHSATPSRKNTPQRSPAPGKPADAKARRLSFKEITEIFKILDKNGDGSITHAEFIVGLKKNAWVAEKLGMPSHVRQEDGTRESYQLSFGICVACVRPCPCLVVMWVHRFRIAAHTHVLIPTQARSTMTTPSRSSSRSSVASLATTKTGI